MFLTLDGGTHGPTHCLGVLGGQVAGNRENISCRVLVHDGHLPALAHITRVGKTLAHQVDQFGTTQDEQTLVAIGGEQHVTRLQRQSLAD